jgi:putative heme-binding domain-containing protein
MDRDPRREEIIAEMRRLLRTTPGDAMAGQEVFKRVCGQCHKLHGDGQEVGPDITSNGRSSFEQLLSNVFDPSLVIGASYQARTVVTTDGRVLTGLVSEEGEERLVLKSQGGKLETIPRRDIETMQVSRLSLMPEDLEKQLKPQELADLFALLTLDKPPSDPAAKKLPGSQPVAARETSDPAQFQALVDDVATGFSVARVGQPGLAILTEHAGRPGVLRTTMASRDEPCVLRRSIQVPKDKRTRLVLSVSHAAGAAWHVKVTGNGASLFESAVGADRARAAWETVSVDLTPLAGKRVNLELVHGAHGGKVEAAYWGQVDIVSD